MHLVLCNWSWFWSLLSCCLAPKNCAIWAVISHSSKNFKPRNAWRWWCLHPFQPTGSSSGKWTGDWFLPPKKKTKSDSRPSPCLAAFWKCWLSGLFALLVIGPERLLTNGAYYWPLDWQNTSLCSHYARRYWTRLHTKNTARHAMQTKKKKYARFAHYDGKKRTFSAKNWSNRKQ